MRKDYSLDEVLEELKINFTVVNRRSKPTLFNCYAWVTEKDLESHPEWKGHDISEMLKRLQGDLLKAGFSAHLDLKSNDPTKSVNVMMDKILTSDYVLCFLTPVFKAKYNDLTKTLPKEFDRIQQRRREKGEESGIYTYRVGEYEESIPEPWDMRNENLLARSMPDAYLDKLKLILKNLLVKRKNYGFEIDQEKRFEEIWAKLDKKEAHSYGAIQSVLSNQPQSFVTAIPPVVTAAPPRGDVVFNIKKVAGNAAVGHHVTVHHGGNNARINPVASEARNEKVDFNIDEVAETATVAYEININK